MIKKIIILLTIALFANCSSSFFDQIATNNIVPDSKTTPKIIYFYKENVITLQWDKDPGADQYILYRSDDPDAGYSEIYRGTDCSYEDSNVEAYNNSGNVHFYYYKLTKKRESKEFDKSNYAIGIAGNIKRDGCEENNDRNSAYNFDISNVGISLPANIYFFRDAAGNTISDIDWYYVNVPPRQLMTITITIPAGGNLISNQDLIISIDGGASNAKVVFTQSYQIYNYSYSPQKLCFCLMPNQDAIVNNDPSGIGGKFGGYIINFQSLTTIP